jgi:asparagine synthase (glutamine-hydrolysing)
LPDDLELRPLDIACGWPLQDVPPAASPFTGFPRETPAAALEAVILPALRHRPCVVSFSGGRDSSIVLAAATRAARGEGLDDPVPATFRFPASARTVEDDWQERVVRHLGLREWVRIDRPEELDLLGPAAQRMLRRHGLLYPPNAFWHSLVAEHARGGAIVTGVGGDELFAEWRWQRAADVLARRVPPRPHDVLAVGLATAPAAVRRRAGARLGDVRLPWLRPAAQRAVSDAWARERAAEPASFRRRVAWVSRLRIAALRRHSTAAVAGDVGATADHPFLHPRFVAALGAAGGRLGPGDRTAAVRALFGDLLPDDVLARRTKAQFNDAWNGPRTRAFVAGWGGGGVDADLVDPGRLAELWRGPRRDARSLLLLHAAWLKSGAPELDECCTPES